MTRSVAGQEAVAVDGDALVQHGVVLHHHRVVVRRDHVVDAHVLADLRAQRAVHERHQRRALEVRPDGAVEEGLEAEDGKPPADEEAAHRDGDVRLQPPDERPLVHVQHQRHDRHHQQREEGQHRRDDPEAAQVDARLGAVLQRAPCRHGLLVHHVDHHHDHRHVDPLDEERDVVDHERGVDQVHHHPERGEAVRLLGGRVEGEPDVVRQVTRAGEDHRAGEH
eukprot:3510320-Pyramimonas_sp.AAC.1